MRVLALMALATLLAGCSTFDRSQAEAGRAASATVAANKKLVVDFYRVVFIEKRVVEGFERYVAPGYIQHNPMLPSGREAAVKFLTKAVTRDSISDIKRVIAEGDLVVLHVHSRNNLTDRGRAVVDIFRVADGKIIEHWDVIQAVPAKAENPNTMF
jgi:predicted SnoaL-like aldol condensation-catalyzing enzyme